MTTRFAMPSLMPGTPKLKGISTSIYENISARAVIRPATAVFFALFLLFILSGYGINLRASSCDFCNYFVGQADYALSCFGNTALTDAVVSIAVC